MKSSFRKRKGFPAPVNSSTANRNKNNHHNRATNTHTHTSSLSSSHLVHLSSDGGLVGAPDVVTKDEELAEVVVVVGVVHQVVLGSHDGLRVAPLQAKQIRSKS